MVSQKEIRARTLEFFRYSQQEFSSLFIAIILTAFIFSFRDWGIGSFDVRVGLVNLFLVFLVTTLSFFFRVSCQKIYALSQGYKAEFKIWWFGLLIMLVVAFISNGRVPLVLVGTTATAFMVKQRLGEFRYGFSFKDNGLIALWGILANMSAALMFAVGLHFLPQNYFFSKGLILNLIMGFFALLPLPQLDGLQVYYGARYLYYVGIIVVLLASVLLLSKTTIGLISAIIIGAIAAIIYAFIGSEK